MAGNFKRIGGTVVLGACMTLAACGHSDQARRADSATAAGDVVADTAGGLTDTTGRAMSTTTATSAVGDTAILAQIATANASEITEGKMAEHKATNPEVKAYARMTVTDHSAMNKKANAVAAKLNISAMPDKKGKDMHEDAVDRVKDLSNVSAKEFDKKYIDTQIDDHQKALDMLKDAKKNAKSPEVVSLIEGAIPTVQKHLDRAKQLQTSLSK